MDQTHVDERECPLENWAIRPATSCNWTSHTVTIRRFVLSLVVLDLAFHHLWRFTAAIGVVVVHFAVPCKISRGPHFWLRLNGLDKFRQWVYCTDAKILHTFAALYKLCVPPLPHLLLDPKHGAVGSNEWINEWMVSAVALRHVNTMCLLSFVFVVRCKKWKSCKLHKPSFEMTSIW